MSYHKSSPLVHPSMLLFSQMMFIFSFSFVTFVGRFRSTTFVCWMSLYRSVLLNLSHVSLLYNTVFAAIFSYYIFVLDFQSSSFSLTEKRKSEKAENEGARRWFPRLPSSISVSSHHITHTHIYKKQNKTKQNKHIMLQIYTNMKKPSPGLPRPSIYILRRGPYSFLLLPSAPRLKGNDCPYTPVSTTVACT